MEDWLFNFVMYSPYVAIGVGGVIYVLFSMLPNGKRRSFFWFLLGNFSVGIVATLIVASSYCSLFPDNLCGLAAYFFFGPLAFSLTILAYSCIWAWHGKSWKTEEAEMKHQMPDVPPISLPEHRLKCPHCGAVMADTDATCVWCAHKTERHS
jgi:hypothetical protein